jgi:protoporphyrinogen oxidase
MPNVKKLIGIIGAGPAGLTAAYLLCKRGMDVVVLEADPHYVGGISRTAQYKGFHFDIGGHRFFSKAQEVEDLWTELLPNDMLERPRLSRIYYNGQFFSYPLKAWDALTKLGIMESCLCVLSYARARLFPFHKPRNFEEWTTNQFGKRLFDIFFKTYTEKVWGMSCKDISADWAAQRIKGLSLGKAILHALLPARKNQKNGPVIKTLIDSFRYPRKGPGMLWEACAGRVRAMGGRILMGHELKSLHYHEGSWQLVHQGPDARQQIITVDEVIASAPLREVALNLTPPLPEPARDAACKLRYRDFLTVVLIARDQCLFDDNWIYIHEPGVKVGRIQNFKSWSPEMVPDPAYACYGLEYFCFEGDGLWTADDTELIALAKREFASIGLCPEDKIIDGCVVRQPKAYPVYDDNYAEHVETLRRELARSYSGLHVIGRNGMHKYNNQDHAMMTAMLCVENIVAGQQLYDLWQVNEDAVYHESGTAGVENALSTGLRHVPIRRQVSPV